jgi:hypothetical protein
LFFAWLGDYIYTDAVDFTHSPSCGENGNCGKFFDRTKASYDEGKDLSKSFLTLIVAVFVASITFSEKIIDIKTAGKWAKAAMITCWISLLLAIAACGTGIVYLSSVLAQALWENRAGIHQMEMAVILISVSGLLFGLGLVMMLLAGLPAFLR